MNICKLSFDFSYGDITPRTDWGKLAVAAYAVVMCGVVGALLQPGREFLENLCRVKVAPSPPERRVSFSDDTRPGNDSSPAKSVKKITSGSYQEATEVEPSDDKKEL